MPIYEYECTSCHHHFDLMQKMSDKPETTCPECHQNTATRLISAAAFQLKGTGWYATDFKNTPTDSAASKKTDTSNAASSAAATTSTQGESK